jgi:hypothetical protein
MLVNFYFKYCAVLVSGTVYKIKKCCSLDTQHYFIPYGNTIIQSTVNNENEKPLNNNNKRKESSLKESSLPFTNNLPLQSSSLSSLDKFDDIDNNSISSFDAIINDSNFQSVTISRTPSNSLPDILFFLYPKNNLVISKNELNILTYFDDCIPYKHINKLIR